MTPKPLKREARRTDFEEVRRRPEKLMALCTVAVSRNSRTATASLLFYLLRNWNLRKSYKRPDGEWLMRSHEDLVQQNVATSLRTSKRALSLLIEGKLVHKREVVVKGLKRLHLAPTPALCGLLSLLEATVLDLDPKLFDALIRAACDGRLLTDDPNGLASVFARLRAGADTESIKADLQRVMTAAVGRIGTDGMAFAKTAPGASEPSPYDKVTMAELLADDQDA